MLLECALSGMRSHVIQMHSFILTYKQLLRLKGMSRKSSKEDVSEIYENLHNLLWNTESFNPETAFEHLNFFIFLKTIESNLSSGKISLSEKCKFNYLVGIKDNHVLFDVFTNKILPEIYENSLTKAYFNFVDIEHCSCLREIINQI